MKDRIFRPAKPRKEDLVKVYKVINQLIKDDDCFYIKDDTRLRRKEKL